MNLIEAWNKAKVGQNIHRTSAGMKSHFIEVNKCIESTLREMANGMCFSSFSFLADDWEIVKEHKKVVIEDVKWVKHTCYDYKEKEPNIIGMYSFFPAIQNNREFKEIMSNGKITKMTLEWDE